MSKKEIRNEAKLFVLGFVIILAVLFFISKFSDKTLDGPLFGHPVSSEEITKISGKGDIIVLTFDGGGGDASARKILDVLTNRKITGTFFLTGKWIIDNPELTRDIVNEGHDVYNHTFSHPHLTELDDYGITKELDDMDRELIAIAGTSSRPFYRPPFGSMNKRVNETAAENGYRPVFWTFDAMDWMESEGETESSVKYRILSNLQPGAIILMHVGDNITGNILDNLINEIQSKGYRLVSLSEAMAL